MAAPSERQIIVFFLLFVSFSLNVAVSDNTNSDQINSVCHLSSCEPFNVTDGSPVFEQCMANLNSTISGRCCLENKFIIGADLTNCSLTSLPKFPAAEISIFIIKDNPVQNTSCQEEDFAGYPALQLLELPPVCSCPGGNETWNQTFYNSSETVCAGMKDTCLEQNITCPANSHCLTDGPGLYQCLCDKGYYGYKCLRTGSFQWLQFGLGISVSTVVTSGGLWLLLRRKAQKID